DRDALAFGSTLRIAQNERRSDVGLAVSGRHFIHAPGNDATDAAGAVVPAATFVSAAATAHGSDKIAFWRQAEILDGRADTRHRSFDGGTWRDIAVSGAVEEKNSVVGRRENDVANGIDLDSARIFQQRIGSFDNAQRRNVAFRGARKHENVFLLADKQFVMDGI